ncbi:MAG: thiamine-phosphate kinase [Pseudomonadota bacterium]|nr:thiamine-phosphate kinase [Pseudomonadota bacterium]MEC8531709.1 thiamine-phosphate kinase [Pseudomonadota bacterium]MEC8726135.1 thiamine-phosphate kinase [Pseudomonadota bacterium]
MGAVEIEAFKLSEFDLIASLFAPLTCGDKRALGLLDDAAILPERTGYETVVTTDTMVSGIHFLNTETPDVIARRLLRVNLSDLASMGAKPTGYFLNLTLPAEIGKDWLINFAGGLSADQMQFNICLLGGDTTHTENDLTLTATFIGEVPVGRAITRSGASLGDNVYVSGTVGDAMLGLRQLKSGKARAKELIRRFQLPEPRVSLGFALRGVASAMADVSDGLVADIGHICRASKVSAMIFGDKVPLSPGVSEYICGGELILADVLAAGDDYELVFTAPPNAADKISDASRSTGVTVTRIGTIACDAENVKVVDSSGVEILLKTQGYRHF